MATIKWYEVLTELSYPVDAISLRKARDGNYEGVVWKSVAVGKIVSDIPSDAIASLLEQGDIKVAKAPKAEEKEG
jgi:hypothetical protein